MNLRTKLLTSRPVAIQVARLQTEPYRSILSSVVERATQLFEVDQVFLMLMAEDHGFQILIAQNRSKQDISAEAWRFCQDHTALIHYTLVTDRILDADHELGMLCPVPDAVITPLHVDNQVVGFACFRSSQDTHEILGFDMIQLQPIINQLELTLESLWHHLMKQATYKIEARDSQQNQHPPILEIATLSPSLIAENLHSVIEQFQTSLWVTDLQLRVTSVVGSFSPCGLALSNPDEIIHHTLYELYKTDDHTYLPIAMHQAALAGETSVADIELRGRIFQFQTKPLQSKGKIIGCLGLAMDVTDRKRIEESERKQRILAEVLQDTTATVSSSLDLKEVLERILMNVGLVVPHHCSSIVIEVDGQVKTVCFTAQGHFQENMYNAQLTHLAHNIGLFKKMVGDETACIVNKNCHNCSLWNTDLEVYEDCSYLQSYIGVPIMLKEEFLGVLNLYSLAPNAFSDQQREILITFANQAAIAIHHARHFEQIQLYAHELDRKVAERSAELHLERESLKTILDSTGEGIFYVEDNIIQYANDTLCQILGYTREEVEGASLQRFMARIDEERDRAGFADLLEAVIENGHVARTVLKFRHQDETDFYAAFTISLVIQPRQQFADRLVVVMRNVDQEKRLEERKKRFLINAAHEIRTPVANLKTRLYLMQRKPDEAQKHLDIIKSSVDYLHELSEDMLTIEAFELGRVPLHWQKVHLQSVVQQVVDSQSSRSMEKQITLTASYPNQPLHIQADPTRIKQLLNNLVVNAIDHTSPNGEISLDLDVNTAQNSVSIMILDNGSGIPLDHLPNIFQPFFTEKRGDRHGTGLGLAITEEIVKQHQGTIEVKSKVDTGTFFKVRLPLTQSQILD